MGNSMHTLLMSQTTTRVACGYQDGLQQQQQQEQGEPQPEQEPEIDVARPSSPTGVHEFPTQHDTARTHNNLNQWMEFVNVW